MIEEFDMSSLLSDRVESRIKQKFDEYRQNIISSTVENITQVPINMAFNLCMCFEELFEGLKTFLFGLF